MSIEEVQAFFGWCAVINIALLMLAWLLFLSCRRFVYRIHGKWFKLTEPQFDMMAYGAFGLYKIGVYLFNIVPYFALWLIRH